MISDINRVYCQLLEPLIQAASMSEFSEQLWERAFYLLGSLSDASDDDSLMGFNIEYPEDQEFISLLKQTFLQTDPLWNIICVCDDNNDSIDPTTLYTMDDL